jgi:MinD-like ATPase involved in chromosome partitioning or flagellar assembly
VSDDQDFYSRYLDGGHDSGPRTEDAGIDRAGEGFDEDRTDVTGPGTSEGSHAARPAGPDQTSVLGPEETEAIRRAAESGGTGEQHPQAPSPDQYWPDGAGGRHGYDTPRRPPGIPPRRPVSGPGTPPGAPGDSEQAAGPAGRRPVPGGPGAGPPNYRGGPEHGGPPSGPNFAPPTSNGGVGQGARPPFPSAGTRGGYGSNAEGASRGRRSSPDDWRDTSVGDMRAQIRESQVAPPYKPVPQMGWRKSLHRVTHVNLGLSAGEREWIDLRRRLKVNLRGNYVIAVMGSKGGVNKTTSTVCLGAAFKHYRDDKIVAIDANPASGNLSKRVDEPSTMSWRGLISDRHLRQYTDFRAYLGRDSSSGLEVLGSDAGDEVLTGNELVAAWERLKVQYPIAIIDCGNQMRDDITKAILEYLPVDAVVVPSTTRLDGARGAAETLNWLLTHGYPHLVRDAVVMVSNINNINASEQVRRLHEDFGNTVRAVHAVPFDDHLSDAVAIDWARLKPATQRAYIEAAASLVDGFAGAADRDSGASGWTGRGGQE